MNCKDSQLVIIYGLALACLILATGLTPARATVVPPLDLTTLVENADLIVAGRVVRQENLKRTILVWDDVNLPAWVVVIRLNIERAIKGNPGDPTVSFRMVVPLSGVGPEPTGYEDVKTGQFGVFFLRRGQNGDEVLDPYHLFVPAAPGCRAKSGNYIDSITAELACVFDSTEPSVQSRWTRWEAVKALETIETSNATTALHAASKDPDTLVRVWAISALLSRGDVSILEQVEKLLPLPPDPQVINLTSQLGMAIGRISDAQAIPSLTRLLKSPDVNIRQGAAAALANTRAGAAIKPLTGALYDADREVQYQAVIGLAEITNTSGQWAPCHQTFIESPEQYLAHWRDWAKSQT